MGRGWVGCVGNVSGGKDMGRVVLAVCRLDAAREHDVVARRQDYRVRTWLPLSRHCGDYCVAVVRQVIPRLVRTVCFTKHSFSRVGA